jgi:hypothetical protein
MTTETETQPIGLTTKGHIIRLLDSITTSPDERRQFANVFSNVGEIISLLFFFLFMSALLSMATAWLLAYPNGPAGLVADLAAAAGQTPAEYIPGLGAALVILSNLFIFSLVMLSRFANIDGQQDDDQTYEVDDVMVELLELTEKVDELSRRVDS